MARFLAVLLVFCGLAGTAAAAKPRLVTDELTGISAKGALALRDTGPAALAGVELVGRPRISPGPVLLKPLGADRYGIMRVLLYRPGQKASVQEELLAKGEALAYDQAALPKAWLKAEAVARTARRGLWAGEAVTTPEKAEEHLGQFTLVQGKVTRSYKGRDMWYLNFGEDWKTDFSLRIPRRAWRGFGKNFTVEDGACMRARGTLFLDNGPSIELTRPEQLEKLDANACRR